MASTSQNYELWDTNKFLGVWRNVEPEYLVWTPYFQNEILSTDEYIDFERMPIQGRKLAPFVLPLGRGGSVYDDKATGFRFKPAYVKLEDRIDPLMPLTRRVGIDANMTQMPTNLTPSQRLYLIRAAMTAAHVQAYDRRLNWMAAVALRDGKITLKDKGYPETLVDFQRAANHTIVLGVGARFGDSGVSIVDFFQLVVDRMSQAEFGAVPVTATMGGAVWNAIRKDAEFKEHMDLNYRGGNITIERGLVSGEQRFKVGEMTIGGGSGARIELWVDNTTYIDSNTGAVTRYIGDKQILFTGTPAAINGYQAFGRIIDRAANWDPMRLFPKNWVTQGDVEVEYITHKGAPLFVPLNPNATLLATVLA